MSKQHPKLLNELKKLKLDQAQVRLFFLRRYLVNRKLAVTVFEPTITKDLAKRLVRTVASRLAEANRIGDYAPLNEDSDDGLLHTDAATANWATIQGKLVGDGNNGAKEVNTLDDLKDCDFYVAEFDFGRGSPLNVAKRLPQKLTISRLKLDQMIFKGGKLDTLDEGKVFSIALGIDFLCWGDHVLIAEKKVFESIMNIREGMTRKRDDVLKTLGDLNCFDGIDVLQSAIGDNAHLLRRVTQIADSGNLADAAFVTKLFEVVDQFPHWGIALKDGKLVITPENTDGVLALLNDARMESFIRRQVFDAVIKKPVASSTSPSRSPA
jgi:hypothetical protein